MRREDSVRGGPGKGDSRSARAPQMADSTLPRPMEMSSFFDMADL